MICCTTLLNQAPGIARPFNRGVLVGNWEEERVAAQQYAPRPTNSGRQYYGSARVTVSENTCITEMSKEEYSLYFPEQ